MFNLIKNAIPDKKRLKKIAALAKGLTLDIGFNENPNPFLEDPIGFDLMDTNRAKAGNYKEIILGNCEKVSDYFPPKHFDTITAGEIIEHLENASQFLRGCREILKDDGTILISTPNPYNISTILANMTFNRKGIAGGHINLFPFRNMLELLRYCGLRCEKVINAVGGTKFLPHPYNRIVFFPMIKSFCWQLLYVIRRIIPPMADETPAIYFPYGSMKSKIPRREGACYEIGDYDCFCERRGERTSRKSTFGVPGFMPAGLDYHCPGFGLFG